jgi:HK97 family phage major capsid protein
LDAKIQRQETLEARQAAIDAQEGQRKDPKPNERKDLSNEDVKERNAKVFEKYIRGDMQSLNSEERSLFNTEFRAQATTPDSAGGYTIDSTMASKIEDALLWYGGAREISNVMSTAKGEQIDYPTNNDTSNSGALLAENTQVSEVDLTFGSLAINAWTYTSNMIRVSNQLITDSSFDIMGYIAGQAGKRVGRITNTHFTTGDGTSKATGFMTDATAGHTTAAASTLTFDDIIALEHTVDKDYRKGAAFTFHDTTLKALKLLKDLDGNYIWQPANAVSNAPATILGYKYAINNDMAEVGAGNDTVAFGDFSKFLIRDVSDRQVRRLSERYADYNQTAFVIFSRHDSKLIDAGTNPIKYITQGA